MNKKMRVMTERPLNAETPTESLRSWITANDVFYDRNQGEFSKKPISLSDWDLTVEGNVESPTRLTYDEILQMPKAIVANTLECSGNGRSLLKEKASGNPWTIGGVGNAVWGGVWLRDVIELAGLKDNAAHIAFEGFDTPLGRAGIKFIRSIPIDKAMASTLLAYEMNGEPLPVKHGFPLRTMALGWVGASCVKWLNKITVLDSPHEGFFMDKVYRIFQKGEDPKSGEVVTHLVLKSIITQPLKDESIAKGPVTILGTAYAGEVEIDQVDVSTDDGETWNPAEFIGPTEPYAWRQWQYQWDASETGEYTILARATDKEGNRQPMDAGWNALGYRNNGVNEHGITVRVT